MSEVKQEWELAKERVRHEWPTAALLILPTGSFYIRNCGESDGIQNPMPWGVDEASAWLEADSRVPAQPASPAMPAREAKPERPTVNEPPTCARCEEEYSLRDGMDPTKYCDSCAHETVAALEAKVAALEAENARLRAKPEGEETLTYADITLLSRIFNRHQNLEFNVYARINDWLKASISAAHSKASKPSAGAKEEVKG